MDLPPEMRDRIWQSAFVFCLLRHSGREERVRVGVERDVVHGQAGEIRLEFVCRSPEDREADP